MSTLLAESAPQLAGIAVNDPRLLAKFLVHTYASDHDADDVGNQLNSKKSGYSTSLNQPATHRSSRSEGLLHYAGSCFNVSTRRVEGRRCHIAYMYNLEKSMSSFGLETEMAPLMTEPEPFHDFSDDQSASSAEVDQPQGHYVGGLTYNKYKGGIRSRDCEPAVDVYKDIHEHEDSYEVQGLAIKRPKDMACKQRSISQKYRPNSFKDILGQKMVAESLSNAILRSKIAPVYLFYGPRGTGKTTAAKIFTCAMNCLSIEELRPCGLCKECISFNGGTNYDTKELDAAGNNEVESMKFMLKHLCLPPSVSRYKVFIMDDCHMLTSEAWNALLKSLEEPPEYVVFILITTNLEQVPRAAVSRCQKFMFSRVKDADIVFRLRKLAQLEKVEIDVDALHFIASQSDGSLRDAEMMLDQLSLLGKKVTLGIVREMVGLIPEDDLINLLEMALSVDTVNTVNTIRELMGSGVDPLALTSQLAMLITDILAGRCPVTRYTGMKVRKDQQDKLQHALKVLSDSEKQLRLCSDRTTWFTAAFLQLSTSSNFHSSSTQPTSAAQSPALLANASKKEAQNGDSAGQRYSWGGKEKWDEYYPSHGDTMQENYVCESSSGPSMDTKIYPCDQSPQSGKSIEEKVVCNLQCRTTQDVNDNICGTLSPRSMNEVWQKVLRGNSSKVLKQFLLGEAKLVSISLAEGFALARLEFRSPEHRSFAEGAKEKISKAFQVALLCPVKVEISFASSQGQDEFTDRGTDHFIQIHSEHHSRRMPSEHENVQGSFRRSTTRNRNVAALSPMRHEVEHRKSLQSIDGDVGSNTKTNTDRSCRDLQVCRGTRDPTSCEHEQTTDARYLSKHQISKEPISFHDSRFSASLRWSDTKDDIIYSSDSENDVRYGPGLLCWKGTRIKDGRGNNNIIRRRRVRFLLRLVPCGKNEGEEDEKMRTIDEI